jgi:5-methylcytosine-specific restriction endonuclease McrA
MEIQKSLNGNPPFGELRESRRALLISSVHEPISFVSYRRMISLLRREVVEVLAHWSDDYILPNQATPAILRLKNFILSKTSHKICAYNRGVVLVRDEYKCQYCDKQLSYREATIDHVLPRSRGGKNTWHNCVTSCRSCNRRKNDRTPPEASMTLSKRPHMPTVAHFWMANVHRIPRNSEWHHLWTEFVKQ